MFALPRRVLSAALAGVLLCALWPSAAVAVGATRWTLGGTDAIGAAIAVSRFAFPTGAEAAVLARADQFPDALAAGVLLRDGPLLLTEPASLSAATAAELARLGVRRVTILGGESAVSAAVADALGEVGYQVARLAGAGRVETAVAVASSRPASRTVLLTRAGAGGDPTQAFADALGAGAWAAASGFPVLLSDSAALSPATAAYLRAAAVRTVVLVGGRGALSGQVEQALLRLGLGVRRVSGIDRAATAAAIAGAQGFTSAADVDRVVVLDGRGPIAWAGGFAAGALARDGRTALLLADADGLPKSTADFLKGGTPHVVCGPLLSAAPCVQAAAAVGAPAAGVAIFEPAGLGDVERSAGAMRSYDVAIPVGGPVTIGLVDAAAAGVGGGGWVLDDDGDGLADGLGDPSASVASVSGVRIAPAGVVGGLPLGSGKVTFTVSAADAPVAVRPVVFVDLDGDGGLDVEGDGSPLEPAAVGGATVWTPADAGRGSHPDQVARQVWPSLAVLSTTSVTHRWGAADTFAYNSGVSAATGLTRAQFEAMVGPGDTLAVNVGERSSRFTIVRDVPAAPPGARASLADTDGDGTPDTVRVTWSRPANIDLAGTAPYTVQRSTRDGASWSGWTDVGEGATPSALGEDVETEAGEHRFRVVAANQGGDHGPPSRPVLVAVADDTAGTPPASVAGEIEAGEAQPEDNTILDVGDRVVVTFDRAIEVGRSASVDLRDDDGTLVRLARDVNAAFVVSGDDGEILTISATAPPLRRPGSEGDDETSTETLVVIEAADGIGNAAGAWNLPESGWPDGEDERSRTIVGGLSDLPEAIDPDDIVADAGLGEVTIAAGAGGITDGDRFSVYDRRGRRIAGGTYDADAGTTVETHDVVEGERVYVVYTAEASASLPSASTALVVPSPRPELDAVQGSGESIVLVWAEDVEIDGDEGDIEVYDAADRLLVSEADDVEQAGDDRVVVELDEALVTGTAYTVRVGSGFVEDEAGDGNDDQSIGFTAAVAAPTLTVSSGVASGATSTAATVTWAGTTVDTVGVVAAVEVRIDGGQWGDASVDADVPAAEADWTATLTLAEGSHTVEVRAVDNNGAVSATVTRTLTINAAPPSVTAAAVAVGASTITVTFSEAVTCPSSGASAWTFDDTSGADNDGVATAVTQAGLGANQCRLSFGGPAFNAATTGTLTYGAPAGAARVVDGAATPMASNTTVTVPAG